MTDPVDDVARAAAERLATEATPNLLMDVDAALLTLAAEEQRETYVIDPISLGSLIVAVATLAHAVYADLRKQTPRPSPEVVARTIRVRVRDSDATDGAQRDRVIDIVVDETVRRSTT